MIDDPNGYDPRRIRLGFYTGLTYPDFKEVDVEVDIPAPLDFPLEWEELAALGLEELRRIDPVQAQLKWRLVTVGYVKGTYFVYK